MKSLNDAVSRIRVWGLTVCRGGGILTLVMRIGSQKWIIRSAVLLCAVCLALYSAPDKSRVLSEGMTTHSIQFSGTPYLFINNGMFEYGGYYVSCNYACSLLIADRLSFDIGASASIYTYHPNTIVDVIDVSVAPGLTWYFGSSNVIPYVSAAAAVVPGVDMVYGFSFLIEPIVRTGVLIEMTDALYFNAGLTAGVKIGIIRSYLAYGVVPIDIRILAGLTLFTEKRDARRAGLTGRGDAQ